MKLKLKALAAEYFIVLDGCLVMADLEQGVAQIKSTQEMCALVIHTFFEAFYGTFYVSRIQVVNALYEEVVRILAKRIGSRLGHHQDFEPHWVKVLLHPSVLMRCRRRQRMVHHPVTPRFLS